MDVYQLRGQFSFIGEIFSPNVVYCFYIEQARPGVLGIPYLGPYYFRYMVFFGQNSGIKYLVFYEF